MEWFDNHRCKHVETQKIPHILLSTILGQLVKSLNYFLPAVADDVQQKRGSSRGDHVTFSSGGGGAIRGAGIAFK